MATDARRIPSAVRATVRRRLDEVRTDDADTLRQQLAEVRQTADRLRREVAELEAGAVPVKPSAASSDTLAGGSSNAVAEQLGHHVRTDAALAAPLADQDTDLGYLFIIAYGRSGSTLLQGILNSIPGYDIHGENRGALRELFRYHTTLNEQRIAKTRSQELSQRSSWYGIDRYDHERAVEIMRSLVVNTVLRPMPGARVVGFKEIRWFGPDWRDYLNFLRRLFPGARFVLNTRSHEAVAQSKWWAQAKEPLKQLQRYELIMDKMAALLGDDCCRVHYDDYVADHKNLAGLFSWLGEPMDIVKINDVMAKKHSY